LLHLGKSQISALVAWFGDAVYSHIAIMADAGELIEAAPGGARRVPLLRRLAQSNDYHFIDLYRPYAAGGRVPTEQQIAAVVRRATQYLGSPYPLDLLVQLGVISALRGRLPTSNVARWIIRIAIDAALSRDASRVMCSEIVYRAMAEALTTPPASMAPTIVVSAPLLLPFPDIDIAKLIEELEALLKPFARSASTFDPAAALDEHHSDAALSRDFAVLREQLGMSAVPAADVIVVPDPNPKTVSPADLERSPSVRFVGRLTLRPTSS
jgi:hypothetical protein